MPGWSELHDWRVKVNGRWTYKVRAPYNAEAAHLGVTAWRKDEKVSFEFRNGMVTKLEIELIAPNRAPVGHR